MRFSTLFGVGLLVASLTGPAQALAQTSPCPPAGIRTDPANPADPSGKINTFNWYYGNYQPSVYNGTMYTLNSPFPGVSQPYIDLPWLQPSNAVMDRFQGRIDTPGDGWELIRRDLGYKDSGAPSQTTNPLLILYNRRTSVLRVFTAVGDVQNNFQFAEIKLKFGTGAQYKAATLNRMSALGVALEDTEPRTNPEFVSATRYLNSRSRWFVADFPMDYDPCICQYDSRLAIEVNLITQADVRLIGKTTGTLMSMKDGGTGTAAGSTGPDMDKGIPFIRKVNSVLEAGGKSYDNIDKFSSKLKDQFPAKAAPIDEFSQASKGAGFLKAGLGALPYVGAAMSMLDYFMGGGKDAGPQEVVMQPMTIEMSTTTEGTITTNNWFTSSTFNNPGNPKPDPVPEKMPYYNEAMGVFSLLKRPRIEVRTTPNYAGTNLVRFSFRLPEDLQYVINPAARLAVQDFQAALVFEGSSEVMPSRPFYDFGGIQTFEGATVHPNGWQGFAYRTDYTDARSIKNNVYSYTWNQTSTAFRHTDVYVKVLLNLRPLDCSTCQNVLYVARYPVTITDVSSYTSLPFADSGVLPEASPATVSAVCNGTKYQTAVMLKRPTLAGAQPTGEAASEKATLSVFPNPATADARLRFTLIQAGPVRLSVHDALGREVLVALDEARPTGAHEVVLRTATLAPGIYSCRLQVSGRQVTKKLAVAH